MKKRRLEREKTSIEIKYLLNRNEKKENRDLELLKMNLIKLVKLKHEITVSTLKQWLHR